MSNNKVKNLSITMSLLLLFTLLIVPIDAIAKEEPSSKVDQTLSGSYIEVVDSDGTIEDGVNYTTVTTFGGGVYDEVVRGDIFLIYPKGTDLTSRTITLAANKDNDVELGGKTLEANGKSQEFTLNLTKENKAIVKNANVDGTENQWEYTIHGGFENQMIQVNTIIDVTNPHSWIHDPDYKGVKGYPVPKFEPDKDPNTDSNEHKRIKKATDALYDITPPKSESSEEERGIELPVAQGTSAMDVLEKVGTLSNMNITGIENGYISEMGKIGYPQIGEFDINAFSGWMYTVDEGDGWYFPNVGANAKTLDRDTTMIWHFTMAYGRDIGAPWGDPGGDPVVPTMLNHQNSNYLFPLQWENSNRSVLEVQ